MSSNLDSPSGIIEPLESSDPDSWFEKELTQTSEAESSVLRGVVGEINGFVQWPEKAILLWRDCDRVPPPGRKQKYFSYPESIKSRARTANIVLDGRPNGPAIAAFLLAGGRRPARFGSKNAWSIHHLYSGKFPYIGRDSTTHATKSGKHFTQSAGLIAVHPVANALVDEFPFFAWFLRAKAFRLFGYDPDSVFGTSDDLGFKVGCSCEEVHRTGVQSPT